MSHAHRCAWILVLAALCGGCLSAGSTSAVSGTGKPLFDARETAFVHPGETTRADVLLRLGQPFWATEDDRVLVYGRLTSTETHVFLILLPWMESRARHDLYLVEFDAAGRVARAEFRSGGRSRSYESVNPLLSAATTVAEWMRESPSAERTPGG